ncbi:hypothetical protein [Jannaschia formosa]|uniref:hypothetical protein n=1 Tax=Jannaschia formosa TaxID=2259592 RepID=UPI000E1C040A|nr:hypothetical protein [Jannaschia formosa]TFL19189.1 hypothetical protein DR046_04470 [Jannaschia formosa]
MKTTIPTLIAAAMLLTPGLAQAQGLSCAPRERIVEKLLDTYGENFSGGGLQSDSAVYEVWTSAEQGTWTILLTRPNGISCVMAAGTDWRPQLERHIVKGVES